MSKTVDDESKRRTPKRKSALAMITNHREYLHREIFQSKPPSLDH